MVVLYWSPVREVVIGEGPWPGRAPALGGGVGPGDLEGQFLKEYEMPGSGIDFNGLFGVNTPPRPATVNPLTQRFKYDFAIAFADPGTFPAADLHKALGRALE